MPTDQLTPPERLRLEALAQAIHLKSMRGSSTTEVMETALRFEKFLIEANNLRSE